MILYELKCNNGHQFDAWFKDGNSFDKQAKRGEVECPVCSDIGIHKAPMAPAVATSSRRTVSEPDSGQRAQEVATEILKALRKVQAHVEKNCDYVGDKFSEEAKAMHYGEAEERGIYGEATDQEASELAEQDIVFHRIPWRQRKDS